MDWSVLSEHEKSGYVGSLLLIIGPFLSVACVPLFGCFNYIDDGRDGIFILGLGLISAYLIKREKFKGLAVTGGLSFLIIFSFWSDISGEEMISTGNGVWVIMAGSIAVCYTSWKAWDISIGSTETIAAPLPISNSPIPQPPKLVPVAKPVVTIECPECEAKMKVTRLGKLQNVTCESCGMAGEINV